MSMFTVRLNEDLDKLYMRANARPVHTLIFRRTNLTECSRSLQGDAESASGDMNSYYLQRISGQLYKV